MPGIREVALLESAIGRPYTGYYPRIHHKSAALAESLARNHGFMDGNKRTAFLITELLIARSDYKLNGLKAHANVELERLIIDIASVHPPQPELARWFKDRLVKV